MFDMKIVDFHKYCATCKNKDKNGYDDPCNECLTTSARPNSHKPIHYEEDKNAIVSEKK